MGSQFFETLTLLMLTFSCGYVLRVSDLLHDNELRWFSWAPIAAAGLAAALAVAMLAASHDALRTFWVAAALSWIVRGRIRRPAWAAAAVGAVGTVIIGGPSLLYDPWASFYFASLLIAGGLIYDHAQTKPTRFPTILRLLFLKPHLYWAGLALGYCALFWDPDVVLCFGLYGFVTGYDALNRPESRRLLYRLGAKGR